MHIILGSQSPQRKQILSFYSLPFVQISSDFAEETVPFRGDPVAYASEIARGKAEALAPRFPEHVILTADTVVYKEGKVFNKPKDEAENFEMLKEFNGSWHSVFTAVVARKGTVESCECRETRVLFRDLSHEELVGYHKAFQGTDKAGGYSVQLGGSVIVKRIEGCFYNVVGLPTTAVQKVLKDVGINLWDYLVS